MRKVIFLTVLCGLAAHAADYRAGIATVVITPNEPIYLSGYAGRTHPSDGVYTDIKAHALVIEDSKHTRVAIVTADIIGFPRSMTDPLAARIQQAYGLERANLLFNASHTHTGPIIGDNLHPLFDLAPRDRQVVERYARRLSEDIFKAVGEAIQNLEPADLWLGHGEARFAINRRQPTPKGVIIGVNPSGPTDPDVPVLKVTAPDGRVRALLLGYACHNTTLTAAFYRISGDYAGVAKKAIEDGNPGVTAMFLQLCGGDQNPNPRSSLELAEQHGKALAAEVTRIAGAKMERVRGRIKAAFQLVDLAFAHHTRSTFEALANDTNQFRARNAKAMLKAYDEGHPVRTYPYPVQAISFGKDLTLVALGGEVVVDYDLRIKKTYGRKGMVVAGYCNDVMGYIPSARVLKEGGYEAVESMVYYGQPGPWREDVEDRIFSTLEQVMKRVGRKRM